MRSVLLMVALLPVAATASLPPPPTPVENPTTADKAVLGKALFWDEQLSSDNTVSCGTCHQPFAGGSDPRPQPAVHPGADGSFGTPDDAFGSFGVSRMGPDRRYVADPAFGLGPQVTERHSQTLYMAPWSPELFWDGRAEGAFVDPQTGELRASADAALESQAVVPLLSDVEMGHEQRDWSQLIAKLEGARPLALAPTLTADLSAALVGDPSYPELFERAFGDPGISATRVAFAMAAYQRTLVPDQTRFDTFNTVDPTAMTAQEIRGLQVFRAAQCAACHQVPFFTDFSYRNIGLRSPAEDPGRSGITLDPANRGQFKVPTLRNVGTKDRFMHNGRFTTLAQVVDFYDGLVPQSPDNQDPLIALIDIPPPQRTDLLAFLDGPLDDPRVVAGTYPFDQPGMHATLDACRDGLDNDGDGLSDANDPGCAHPDDPSEHDHDLVCDDGLDNDRDGLVDGMDADCDDLCLGDDVTGDRDGDGLCDDLDVVLEVGEILQGRDLTLTLDGVPPGAVPFLFVSTRGEGAGPCHPTAGICASILRPTLLSVDGGTEVVVRVPRSLTVGTELWLQGGWFDGGAGQMSNIARRRVVLP